MDATWLPGKSDLLQNQVPGPSKVPPTFFGGLQPIFKGIVRVPVVVLRKQVGGMSGFSDFNGNTRRIPISANSPSNWTGPPATVVT